MQARSVAVPMPVPVRRRLEFFAASSSSCELAARQFEYKTKDTVRLAGQDRHLLAAHDTGSDRSRTSAPDAQRPVGARADDAPHVREGDGLLPRQRRGRARRPARRSCRSCCTTSSARPERPFSRCPATRRCAPTAWAGCGDLFDPACRQYDAGLDRDDPVGAPGRVGRGPRRRERRRGAGPARADRARAGRVGGAASSTAHVRRRARAEVPAPALHELPALAAVERRVSDGVDRGSAFGRWLTADRAAVDALLAGALARGATGRRAGGDRRGRGRRVRGGSTSSTRSSGGRSWPTWPTWPPAGGGAPADPTARWCWTCCPG